MPAMEDPRFARTVICLCAHSGDGAMGIVLNKPLEGLSFDDLLKQLNLDPLPPQRRIRLMSGGPVENGRGFVLHTADWETEGSLKVQPGIALTASVDILKAIAGGGGPREGLLALGYAGWGPGQLETEFQQNAWLSVPADEELLFGARPEKLWHRALAKLHVDPALLSGVAGHA
jgi:putative transcriptional regulator